MKEGLPNIIQYLSKYCLNYEKVFNIVKYDRQKFIEKKFSKNV